MASSDPLALTLKMTYLRQVNWSLLRAGIPLVWSLEVTNRGCAPAKGLTVRFSLLRFLTPPRVPLPEIKPGETKPVDLTNMSWLWDFGPAFELDYPAGTTLKVEVGGQVAECPIQLLTPDEWCAGVAWDWVKKFMLDSTVELAEATFDLPPGGTVRDKKDEKAWTGSPPLQAATAALVLPEHPQVVKLKKNTIENLRHIAGNVHVSLANWVSKTSGQPTQVVQAAFVALAELHPSHDIEKFSLRPWSQRIRFPDEVISDEGRATCVDYALLMCALLEACGLRPLFILVGTADQICHALVGVWLDGDGGQALLTDVQTIRQYVKDGKLLVVDVTEAARKKKFAKACRRGRDCLTNHQFLYALDIGSTRNPLQVAPLPWRSRPRTDGDGGPPSDGNRGKGPPARPKSNRKALGRYLECLLAEHQEFTFLERGKPLDLEKIYIALKVGEYVPWQRRPDDPSSAEDKERTEPRSGVVEAKEALLQGSLLAVLGEPGSGKTTLLKYLALRTAKRDPALGEFARKRMPRWLPCGAERVRRRLAGVNLQFTSLVCIWGALFVWLVGLCSIPRSLRWGFAALGIILACF